MKKFFILSCIALNTKPVDYEKINNKLEDNSFRSIERAISNYSIEECYSPLHKLSSTLEFNDKTIYSITGSEEIRLYLVDGILIFKDSIDSKQEHRALCILLKEFIDHLA